MQRLFSLRQHMPVNGAGCLSRLDGEQDAALRVNADVGDRGVCEFARGSDAGFPAGPLALISRFLPLVDSHDGEHSGHQCGCERTHEGRTQPSVAADLGAQAQLRLPHLLLGGG
jgi:hypothetical protein